MQGGNYTDLDTCVAVKLNARWFFAGVGGKAFFLVNNPKWGLPITSL